MEHELREAEDLVSQGRYYEAAVHLRKHGYDFEAAYFAIFKVWPRLT